MGENCDTCGQGIRNAGTRKRGDHAHLCATYWLGVPRLFLSTPLSSDAVAFYLSRGEQRLRYEKLATSSLLDGSFKFSTAARHGVVLALRHQGAQSLGYQVAQS